jgi:hypothetical protein
VAGRVQGQFEGDVKPVFVRVNAFPAYDTRQTGKREQQFVILRKRMRPKDLASRGEGLRWL